MGARRCALAKRKSIGKRAGAAATSSTRKRGTVVPAGYLTRTEWAAKIARTWRQALQAIVETGRLLVDAKQQLSYGEWGAMVKNDLPFTPRYAQMLMAIARDPVLADAKHASLLPPSPDSLYRLSRLPDGQLERALATGQIRPDMERRDVRALRLVLNREAVLRDTEHSTPLDDGAFIHGNALDHIGTLENGSVQLLLCDPPYGSEHEGSSADPLKAGQIAGDTEGEAADLLRQVLTEMEPKLAPDAHCYIFTTLRRDSFLRLAPVVKEFFDIRGYITWVKGSSGQLVDGFALTTELIIFGTRGGTRGAPKRQLIGKPLPDVVVRDRVPDSKSFHQHQKPLELLETLIAKSTLPGELVVDPLAGSGSTLVAAKETGRAYWGVEREKKYHEPGLAWLTSTKLPDTSLKDFSDLDAGYFARPYSFVTDATGIDHVMFQKELGPVGSATDVFRPMPSDAPRPLRDGTPDAAAAARYRKGPGLNDGAVRVIYEPVCDSVEAVTTIALPPLHVCKDCSRWLASHGDRDIVNRAAASEREFWVTGMIAPAQYDRIVKKKGKQLKAGKARGKKVD
ncbi:MAG: DUF3102 domain-containing protein [Chloroflexota bacterium]|nr:DUF3102 domain-containing protein [Chloroflexota bacterium]